MLGRELFLDASYLIALGAPGDQHHIKAREIMRELEATSRLFVTTQAVLFEVGDALCKPKHRQSAFRLLQALEADPRTQIVFITEELYTQGLQLFRRRSDKEWSLTDCISFEVMSDFGITQALTTDEHFEQAGFKALLRE